MNEKVKRELDQLQSIVLDFHRTADSLDRLIRELEHGFDEGNEPDVILMYIRQLWRFRMDFKQVRGYSELDQKEDEAWNNLIKAVLEEKGDT